MGSRRWHHAPPLIVDGREIVTARRFPCHDWCHVLGNVAWKTKIFLYVHQDQSSRCNYEGRVGSTYPCRSLSGSVKNAVDGVVLAAIQIAEDPSTEATVPPRSSHVRLGDVSSFLIQQGVEERLMERPAARRRGGDGGGGFQQGFA